MPNIPTYDQPGLGLTPTEVGIQSRTQAAYRGKALFNEAASALSEAGHQIGSGIQSAGDAAVSYMDHQQINAGADHGASLFANLTESWNQTAANADPHDPAVAKKWREEQLQPALEQFQKGFTTEKSQEWASHFVNQMREHMFAKTEADMSSLAAEAVSTTVRNLGNKFSNVAVTDPSAVPAMLDQVDHSIDGIIGANQNLKGAAAGRVRLEVGEKIKEQIVKFGAFGAITNSGNPEAAAAAWSKKFPDYINGAEELQLARAAKTQAKSNLVADRQAALLQKQTAEADAAAAINKSWSANVKYDETTGRVTIDPKFIKDMALLPMLHQNAPNATALAESKINWAEAQQKKASETDDPQAVENLTQLLSNPNASQQAVDLAIDKASTLKQLSPRTEANFRRTIADMNSLKDPVFAKVMDEAKKIVSPTTAGREKYPGAWGAFYFDFIQNHYLPQQRAGTLQPNALDMGDKTSLISQSIQAAKLKLHQVISGNGGLQSDQSKQEIPVPLRGIGALEHNQNWTKFRDQTTGKIYDAQGNEIKK